MPQSPNDPRRRAPAGAAVLQEDVTVAIHAAVLEELAAVGYGRMSIEAVARRAGVGKTAVYRRWKSKLEMTVAVVSQAAVHGLRPPDTGSLRGDVRALLGMLAQALRHPLAAQIIPDLLAEAARNPEIARTLEVTLRAARRDMGEVVIGRAVARGEAPPGVDVELALDMIVGPLYWRLAVARADLPDGWLDSLASAAAAALSGNRGDPA
ncbi:TetR/AcrR family transcriptional regulator [Streptomyces meridianus]|uniref:TetR/AcrR family transcriptional regulator n=1 Tax=Streptomyces meridianus TaxID=2938945 RepID=A0ABT0XBM8_9ACTN|nr:TetR/AcrR family transcriptional regulator [Streptomyces meridianus]MCM2579928.1 TetR/AcrR family transcriptional regulator [Streptomyces meridianus]